jgi:predicted Rossmann fold nucleotide-binding protein DprA/Smf involved in DNA uptake
LPPFEVSGISAKTKPTQLKTDNKTAKFFLKSERKESEILRKAVKIQKIISGGQTGVDRAAFDFALENGIKDFTVKVWEIELD